MMPRRIISSGTVSQCATSMIQHLQQRGTIARVPLTRFPRIHFSSGSDGGGRLDEQDTEERQKHQQRQQLQKPYENDRTNPTQVLSSQRKNRILHPSHGHSGNKISEIDNPSEPRSSRKKWRAPFWVPPASLTKSSSSTQQKNARNHYKTHGHKRRQRNVNQFRNASLPVRQHLATKRSSMDLPTSDWVQIFGSLPMTSVEEVLDSIENILRKEVVEGDGIIDLDAQWNPHRDGEEPPLVPSTLDYPIENSNAVNLREYVLDKATNNQDDSDSYISLDGGADICDKDHGTTLEMESFRVVKAHVVLSPFGRPTGWNLKLANPSMVHALLTVARNARVRGSIRIGWKFAQVSEHHTPPAAAGGSSHDPGDTRTMLVINDSMVRFENCPDALTEDHLRHMLSRYELTHRGSTILRWMCRTSDGRVPPPTFVVRFANPANARAAVREMQGKILEGKAMKLIQYPQQLL